MNKISRAILLSVALLLSFLFTSSAYAESSDPRLYKISILIFKHLPPDKNTSPPLIDRWSEQTFAQSIDSNLLPTQPSALAGSYYALSRDKHYSIIYNSAWVTPLEYGKPTQFHFYKTFDDSGNKLDGLINITLKYTLDVNFQTQLLTPTNSSYYTIFALDETYQTPSNQLEYIDGPVYGALVLITHYDGNSAND